MEKFRFTDRIRIKIYSNHLLLKHLGFVYFDGIGGKEKERKRRDKILIFELIFEEGKERIRREREEPNLFFFFFCRLLSI